MRGAVLSVVDYGRFAGGEPAGLTPSARLLVTRAGSARVALLVDRVGTIGDVKDGAELLNPETLIASFADFQTSGEN